MSDRTTHNSNSLKRLPYKGNPKLTISLLSSGRIATIERCLSSLDLLRSQIASEVIVVDTDPDEKEDVRHILEVYADKIIPFTWIDDFSAARNLALKEAKGEWFLFVDDDEWFLDSKPLIDFLLSSKSRHCHGARVIVRSFFDQGMNRFKDDWIPRLVRMTDETRFVGIVHEYIMPFQGDGGGIETVIGHSGYIFQSEQEDLEHSKRNIRLLEKQLVEDNNDIHSLAQLLAEYIHLNDLRVKR